MADLEDEEEDLEIPEVKQEVWLVLAMTMMAVAVAGGLKTEDRGEREETERGSAFTLKPLETTGFSWISEISACWWLATVTTNTANPSDRRFSVKWAVTATPESWDWRVTGAREGSGRISDISTVTSVRLTPAAVEHVGLEADSIFGMLTSSS